MSASFFIVADPNLRLAGGHYLENTLETVRAVKKLSPNGKVLILTGPQELALRRLLDAEVPPDSHAPMFQGPRLSNSASPRELLKECWRAAGSLGRLIRELRPQCENGPVPILFTDLWLFELLTVAFLRIRFPSLKINASGIVRAPATDLNGRLLRKYDLLMRRAKPLWHLATSCTQFWADSPYVQQFIETELHQPARLAPICVAGVWTLKNTQMSPPPMRTPMKVSFVGDPTHRRGFDLYALTAAAMHEERNDGKLIFSASVTAPRFGVALPNSLELLKHLGKGIEVVEGELPGDTFAAAMNQSDIVWAVGHPDFYSYPGTSGIYTHAMCLGKRVLTNSGSWAQRLTAPIATARFIPYKLGEAVRAIRALAITPADESSWMETKLWRERHSRRAYEEFIAARVQ